MAGEGGRLMTAARGPAEPQVTAPDGGDLLPRDAARFRKEIRKACAAAGGPPSLLVAALCR